MTKLLLAAVAALIMTLAPANRTLTRRVAPGVTLRQTIQDVPRRILTAVEIDPKQPGVRIGTELGQDDVENDGLTHGRETVTALARRKNLTAAVNADYFYGGAPVGLCIRNGELVSLPYPNRAVCAFFSDRGAVFDVPQATASVRVDRTSHAAADAAKSPSTFPLAGLNRGRGANALVLYSPIYGPKTLTNAFGTEVVLANASLPLKAGRTSAVVQEVRAHQGGTLLRDGLLVLSGNGTAAEFLNGLNAGDPVEIDLSLRSPHISDWRQVENAVGGGPFLVRGGRVSIDAVDERFQPDVVLGRSPRTAVGVTADGRILLVTIDGRQPMSAGMSLAELADWMRSLGCETAMNLDGGGSTTMAVEGVRVNSPSDGSERSVAEMLAVRAPALPDASGSVHLVADLHGPIDAGQSVPIELRDDDGEPVASTIPLVWGVEGSIGFVDQSGYFTAFKAGKGRVVVRRGDETTAMDIEVIASKVPERIVTAWRPLDAGRPFSNRLTATVLDASGNPIPGIRVDLTLPAGAGSADALSRTTDSSGTAEFEIVWARGAAQRLTVASGAITATTQDTLSPAATPPIAPGH